MRKCKQSRVLDVWAPQKLMGCCSIGCRPILGLTNFYGMAVLPSRLALSPRPATIPAIQPKDSLMTARAKTPTASRNVLVLLGSPREDGNSTRLLLYRPTPPPA